MQDCRGEGRLNQKTARPRYKKQTRDEAIAGKVYAAPRDAHKARSAEKLLLAESTRKDRRQKGRQKQRQREMAGVINEGCTRMRAANVRSSAAAADKREMRSKMAAFNKVAHLTEETKGKLAQPAAQKPGRVRHLEGVKETAAEGKVRPGMGRLVTAVYKVQRKGGFNEGDWARLTRHFEKGVRVRLLAICSRMCSREEIVAALMKAGIEPNPGPHGRLVIRRPNEQHCTWWYTGEPVQVVSKPATVECRVCKQNTNPCCPSFECAPGLKSRPIHRMTTLNRWSKSDLRRCTCGHPKVCHAPAEQAVVGDPFDDAADLMGVPTRIAKRAQPVRDSSAAPSPSGSHSACPGYLPSCGSYSYGRIVMPDPKVVRRFRIWGKHHENFPVTVAQLREARRGSAAEKRKPLINQRAIEELDREVAHRMNSIRPWQPPLTAADVAKGLLEEPVPGTKVLDGLHEGRVIESIVARRFKDDELTSVESRRVFVAPSYDRRPLPNRVAKRCDYTVALTQISIEKRDSTRLRDLLLSQPAKVAGSMIGGAILSNINDPLVAAGAAVVGGLGLVGAAIGSWLAPKVPEFAQLTVCNHLAMTVLSERGCSSPDEAFRLVDQFAVRLSEMDLPDVIYHEVLVGTRAFVRWALEDRNFRAGCAAGLAGLGCTPK